MKSGEAREPLGGFSYMHVYVNRCEVGQLYASIGYELFLLIRMVGCIYLVHDFFLHPHTSTFVVWRYLHKTVA